MQGPLKDGSRVARVWDWLWFSRVDARDLAGMRISMGLLLLVWHLFLWPDLWLISADGPMDMAVLDGHWSQYRSHWFDAFTTSDMQVVHVAVTALIVCYIFGLGTPVAGVLILLWLSGVWHRSPWIQNGGDRLLRIMLFYMVLSPSWRAWSLDRLILERRGYTVPDDAPMVGVRLVQLQMVVMYTYTGIAKLGGFTWLQGSALYYSWLDASYSRFPVQMEWLMAWAPARWLGAIGTYAALVFEIAFLPLIAWRKTRVPTLWFGLLMHLGIWLTLSVGIFSWSSVWGYLVFLRPGWAGRLAERVRAWREGSPAPQT